MTQGSAADRAVALLGLALAATAATPALASGGGEAIAWRAWGDEAFVEARRRDQPVLLVIADPACGACGEEEREALGDEDAARLVSAGFVAVAVDRFDRPDLAAVFASLLDAPASARRGALVVFLLPDGRPFAAHRGLSRKDSDRSPGLRTLVLRRLSDFRNDRPGAEAAAARNLERLRRAQQAEPPRGPLGPDVVERALRGLTESFDADSGGFGPAGEIPPGAPRFLLEQFERRRAPDRRRIEALLMAVACLDRLAARQQEPIASVLPKDALVLRGLAQSHGLSPSAGRRAAAEALATRVLGEMRDEAGAFQATRSVTMDARVIAGWNGLMIGALATSGWLLERPSDIDAAGRAAARVLDRLGPASALRHSALGQTGGGPAFLDDYAYLAEGLLDLRAATGESRWLTEAVALTEAAIGRFLDPRNGGFFSTEAAHAPFPVRLKQGFDTPLPSPNGVMARVLLRLDRATGERRYGELAHATVEAFRGDLQRAPRGMETLAGAAAEVLDSGAGTSPGGNDRGASRTTRRPAREVVGPVSLEASLSGPAVRAGGTVEARLRLVIDDGWRIVAREPGVKDLLGLVVSVTGEEFASDGPRYPEARQERGPWNTGAVSVYAGQVTITVPLRVTARALPGDKRVGLRVVFQPCDASGCQPPRTARVEVPITVEALK